MNHFGPFLGTLDLRLFWRKTHVLENNSDNKTKIRHRTRDFVPFHNCFLLLNVLTVGPPILTLKNNKVSSLTLKNNKDFSVLTALRIFKNTSLTLGSQVNV